MSQLDTRIGPKIKAFRRQLGIQANKLADQLNISPSYLTLIEGGKRKIDADLLIKICEELKIEISDLLVCQCSKCGIVQVVNKPVGYYKEVIRSSAFSKEMKDYRKNQFKKFINKYKLKKKKIIEIGSGYGEYLSLLDKENLKSFGIEFSNNAIKVSRKKKLNVMKGYINKVNYKINHSPFDAFFIC